MSDTQQQPSADRQKTKSLFRGELALAIAVLTNSFAVVLMLYSRSGISAISSVPYAFSGKLLDFHEFWIQVLPTEPAWCVVYFIISYLLICFGVALSNRCGLPIIPTNLFPRELAQITGIPYPKIKISFDAICVVTTAALTFFFLGHVRGIGIGTVLAALSMGKVIGLMDKKLSQHFYFATRKMLRQQKQETK